MTKLHYHYNRKCRNWKVYIRLRDVRPPAWQNYAGSTVENISYDVFFAGLPKDV